MIFVDTPANVPLLLVDDMYSAEELELMWKELSFLTTPTRMQAPEKTSAAKTEEGEYKKNASGVFLDSFYTNRNSSDILQINRKLFTSEIKEQAVKKSLFYHTLRNINNDYTLINYYEDKQEYKPHHDTSVFTAITFFFKEPIKFSGGELVFPDFDLTVPIKNNRMVLFPGAFIHGVTPIVMNEDNQPYSGYGRYSMAQFLCNK